MTPEYEVIVVGAGPAGTTLSYLLARSGKRVALLEAAEVLDREFRGPAYQPAVARLWDEMGILSDILELDVHQFGAFSFFEEGEKKGGLDLSHLPPPYNKLTVMQQASLLKRMVALCGQYPNFTYLGACPVTDLIEGGVKCAIGELRAPLIVGCDGRFSAVRKAAGIEMHEAKQAFDVVWYEIDQFEGATPELGFYSTPSGILLYIPKEGGKLQVGWIIQKGEYQKLKAGGLDAFKEVIGSIDRRLAAPLTSWEQCHLLDVKIGMAKEWTKEGVLLLGDAAHIASPMGALGNKFAIEDAVLAHPYIMEGIPFLKRRQRQIRGMLHLQRIMGSLFLQHHFIRRYLLPIITKTPIWKGIIRKVALSKVSVQTRYFRDPPRRYHLLKVKQIITETSQAKTFIFETPPSFAAKAGQFITLRLLKGGRQYKRCYSLSSLPGEELAITVKRVEGGVVSTALHDEVRVGDRLLLLPPAGEFVACNAPAYTFIAAGSGITPVYSLIRSLLPHTKVTLLYVNTSSDTTIFRRQLDDLQRRYPDTFTLHHHWTAEKGRPTQKTLQPYLTPELYLCGPPALMALTGDTPSHRENYASVTGLQEERPSPVAPAIVGSGEESTPETLSVTLNGRTQTIPCRPNETLLDAALSAGLPAPFSCQEGICKTCKATLLSGKVRMDRHDALTDQEMAKGEILTCRAKSLTSTCSVNYPSQVT